MGTPETTDLSALQVIADKLIASDPLNQSSWDVDVKLCLPIAKAHLKHWSLDKQRRDERRAKGKSNIFHSSKNDGNFLSRVYGNVSILDTEVETKAIRKMRKEPHSLNRFNNVVANSCAELCLNRTSSPYYYDEPNAYPFRATNEKVISDQVKDLWVYMRGSSGTATASFSDDFRKQKIYASTAVRIELFTQSGLADRERTVSIFKQVYPGAVTSFVKANPSFETGLGASIHGERHPDDKIYVAAMACRGMFSGIFTWNKMNSFLVQGGWPWLRQYPKAYARLIFTVMMLIFAAIESYHIRDMNAMSNRLLGLAGKLVGHPNGQSSYWKVRKGPYLKGPKVTIPSSGLQSASNQPAPNGGEGLTNPTPALSTVPWTNMSENPPALPNPLPTHIVYVETCQHGVGSEAPLTTRVKVAHSISDLDDLTANREHLVVALTWGEQRSVQEVCAWVVQNSIMTVKKGDNQCISCAVNLSKCIAALVLIA